MAFRSDRLRELRERREFTQEELAARAGVTLRSIQRYEDGENPRSLDIVQRLAKALTTSHEFLLDETTQADPNLEWDDLSNEEKTLILALRKRKATEAIQAFATLTKDIE